MRHVHADMICRLANDTSLSKLVLNKNGFWVRTTNDSFRFDKHKEYRLVVEDDVVKTLRRLNGVREQILRGNVWVSDSVI